MSNNPYQAPAMDVPNHGKISDSIRAEFAMQTRVMMAIAIGLTAGACLCGVMVCVTADWAALQNFQAIDVLPMVGVVLAIGAFLASFVVPVIVRGQGVKQLGDPAQFKSSGKSIDSMNANHSLIEKLLAIFQTTLIIRLALIEGATFFNLMMFMLETHPVNLCLGIFGILLLLMAFPFPARIWGWVESTIEDMQFQTPSK